MPFGTSGDGCTPSTLVLSEDTPWKRPYREPALGRAGFGRSFVSSLLRSDSRLPQSALVVGVEVDGPYGAYVLDLHEAADRVANDEIADSRSSYGTRRMRCRPARIRVWSAA